jgi:hypothetical protein
MTGGAFYLAKFINSKFITVASGFFMTIVARNFLVGSSERKSGIVVIESYGNPILKSMARFAIISIPHLKLSVMNIFVTCSAINTQFLEQLDLFTAVSRFKMTISAAQTGVLSAQFELNSSVIKRYV